MLTEPRKLQLTVPSSLHIHDEMTGASASCSLPAPSRVKGLGPNIMWFHIERNSAVVPERRARKPEPHSVLSGNAEETMNELASSGERPETFVSMKQTTPVRISLKNCAYRPARSSSRYHLYDMCSQTLSFSSQPGEKAIMRPTSIGSPTRLALTLYILSSSSCSAEAATALYTASLSASGLFLSVFMWRTGPSRKSGSVSGSAKALTLMVGRPRLDVVPASS
mmetsp:Transcript_1957/g.4820  ORF Transcript_1957/g.4820 Transcript_1957/m.4820 type:complete len:223 (-) Transcript_1957:2842-3510(-)